MKSENVGVLLFLPLYLLLFLALVVAILYFKEINQLVKNFFENRNIQKIAKRLGLIDKGVILSTTEKEILSDGSCDFVEYSRVHTFCRTRLRIGLLQGVAVKWCSVCESVLVENDDNDGGDDNDKDPLDPPPPLDVVKTAGDVIEKMKNGLGCS